MLLSCGKFHSVVVARKSDVDAAQPRLRTLRAKLAVQERAARKAAKAAARKLKEDARREAAMAREAAETAARKEAEAEAKADTTQRPEPEPVMRLEVWKRGCHVARAMARVSGSRRRAQTLRRRAAGARRRPQLRVRRRLHRRLPSRATALAPQPLAVAARDFCAQRTCADTRAESSLRSDRTVRGGPQGCAEGAGRAENLRTTAWRRSRSAARRHPAAPRRGRHTQ